jgi:hypothetical protein
MKWRYSLRWKLPHKPCPGPLELVSVVVEAGQAAPEEGDVTQGSWLRLRCMRGFSRSETDPALER